MEAIEPGIAFKVANKLGDGSGEKLSVNLRFEKMDDFSPAAVARQVPALAKLLQARQQLANLLRYMDGKVAAEDQIKKLLNDPQLMEALKERMPDSTEPPADDEARQGIATGSLMAMEATQTASGRRRRDARSR